MSPLEPEVLVRRTPSRAPSEAKYGNLKHIQVLIFSDTITD